MAEITTGRREAQRWQLAADVLTAYRRNPHASRVRLADGLHLGSGTMSELVGRLLAHELLREAPAPAAGRGRPTTLFRPHSNAPAVIAVDIAAAGWQIGVAGVDGRFTRHGGAAHESYLPAVVLGKVRTAITAELDHLGQRAAGVAVSIAATVQGTLVHSSALGWEAESLESLAVGLPLTLCNDATAAGVAEARRGAARGANVSLHLHVLSGLGGGLCVGGVPTVGATGAASEYGHMPFGDPTLPCECGARGCWLQSVGGVALARAMGADHLSRPEQVTAAWAALGKLEPSAPVPDAVRSQIVALARGTAGLVNGLDPEVVTLGGLAPKLRAAAPKEFDDAYLAGLMRYRRPRPPRVRDGKLGTDAPVLGVVELALDKALNASALALRAARS
ncbi:MAG TPA: XylR family transcriptional regulator [Propionibacteriaceae bacterium]|nr:ROK family protein [Micropruina sp.]HBX81594.1 XylR family transcriptional regulator [Propionibacteriaceae bacterium]HBY23323.1 XylR family transcriptional regulator [Propionibacteriaceae bacterium]